MAPPNVVGQWVTPAFNHDDSNSPSGWPLQFNAVHMAVIPVQTGGVDHRGHVLVFDEGSDETAGQRWAILDPISQQTWNYVLPPVGFPARVNGAKTTPPGQPPHEDDGDLFCSGHAWTMDGKLFVAGGTVWDPPNNFWAARLAFLWDPQSWNVGNGGWVQKAPLEQGRYYPSVTRFGDDRLLVSGGFDQDLLGYLGDPILNPVPPATFGPGGAAAVAHTYEVFNASTGQWDKHTNNTNQVYNGLAEGTEGEFNFYPRFHLLADPSGGTNGWLFYAGFARNTARAVHDASLATPSWNSGFTVGSSPGAAGFEYFHYGSSVLLPIDLNAANTGEDRIVRFGGGHGGYLPFGLAVRDQVEICKPTVAGLDGQWQSYPWSMHEKRMHINAVLLPDGSTLVVGGTATEAGDSTFVRNAEFLADGLWTLIPDLMASGRGYHSVAVLLPNGMVLIGGGEGRSVDYQLYQPRYFFKGPRPVITSAVTGGPAPDRMVVTSPGQPENSAIHELTYTCAPGTQAEKVVLMRPCSVTHHSDFDQRSVALAQVPAPDGMLKFKAPKNNLYAPWGHYMLFVVDSNGVPSEATWVQLVP